MSADKQLKSYIDRVLRLKEEQDTLGDDIRDVYAEAKAEGYDKTVMGKLVAHLRKVLKQGDGAVAEAESIFDTYLQAYHRASGTPVATHTHEEKYDPATGEFLGDIKPRLAKQIVDGMQTEAGRAALIAAVDILIEREEAEEMDRATEGSFETGSEAAEKGREAIPARPEGADLSHAGAGESPATNSVTDAAISRPGIAPLGRPEIENRSDEEASVSNASGEMQDEVAIHLPTNSEIASASQGDAEAPSAERVSPTDETSSAGANTGGENVAGSVSRAGQSHTSNNGEDRDLPNHVLVLRPNCRFPKTCHSGTRDHCHSCKRAMQGDAA